MKTNVALCPLRSAYGLTSPDVGPPKSAAVSAHNQPPGAELLQVGLLPLLSLVSEKASQTDPEIELPFNVADEMLKLSPEPALKSCTNSHCVQR